jgi:hypothetical protein
MQSSDSCGFAASDRTKRTQPEVPEPMGADQKPMRHSWLKGGMILILLFYHFDFDCDCDCDLDLDMDQGTHLRPMRPALRVKGMI